MRRRTKRRESRISIERKIVKKTRRTRKTDDHTKHHENLR